MPANSSDMPEKVQDRPIVFGEVLFISVALVGLLRGWSVPLMMQRAQQFAARICQQKGATSADATLYREAMEVWK